MTEVANSSQCDHTRLASGLVQYVNDLSVVGVAGLEPATR